MLYKEIERHGGYGVASKRKKEIEAKTRKLRGYKFLPPKNSQTIMRG